MCIQNGMNFSIPTALPNPFINLLHCSFTACPCIPTSRSEQLETKTSTKEHAKAKHKPPAQDKQKKTPKEEVQREQDEMESPEHDPDDYEDMELKQSDGSFTDDEDLYQNA